MRRLIRHIKGHPNFAAGLLLTLVVAVASLTCADRQIVINTSPSVAPGLYVRSRDAPAVGRLVDFRVPAAVAEFVRSRTHGRTNGGDWYILKPIAAGPGDVVDCTGRWLVINGRQVAGMPTADDEARGLPVWRGRRTLDDDEFFVFSSRIPNSFDSRCYGPIRRSQVAAVRTPLVTW